MAVIVSKKVAKSAVDRNRIRRRVFETVRKSHALDSQAIDAVFVVNDIKIKDVSQLELDMQILNACQKMI